MQRRFATLVFFFLATLCFATLTFADETMPHGQFMAVQSAAFDEIAPAEQQPAQQVPKSAYDRPFKTPEMTALPKDVKPFEYKDVGKQIPNYKGGKGVTLNLQQLPLRPEESTFHGGLQKAVINCVFEEVQGTAHDWQTWRWALNSFAPQMFQQTAKRTGSET